MARNTSSTSIRLTWETLRMLHEANLRLVSKVLKGEVTLDSGQVRTPSLDDTVRWLIREVDGERQRKAAYAKDRKKRTALAEVPELVEEDTQAQPEQAESA